MHLQACTLVGWALPFVVTCVYWIALFHPDDVEEVQAGEGPWLRQRGRALQEQGYREEEPRPGDDEPKVQDDPRGVIAGQLPVLRQPCHALLVPLQQARSVTAWPRGERFAMLWSLKLAAVSVSGDPRTLNYSLGLCGEKKFYLCENLGP